MGRSKVEYGRNWKKARVVGAEGDGGRMEGCCLEEAGLGGSGV